MRFATQLKAARERMQLSQPQLGELLGVTRQAVSLWETGVCYPRDARLDRLCVLMGWDYHQMTMQLREEEKDS